MKRPLMAVCMCFAAFMVLAACRREVREAAAYHNMTDWNDKTITVTAHVYRKDTQFFYLDSVLVQIQAAGQQQNFSLKDNLICEYENIAPQIGSSVKIQGTFHTFRTATNPGEFDSAAYYKSQGVIAKLTDIVILREEGGSAWQEALFELRNYFRERLYRILPQKEASVMTAMLLGDKNGLDAELKRLYQENGIVHILSISGLHITIIGMSIYRLLRRLGMPVWAAAVIAATVLAGYGIMTGMSVSACRAIGMFLIKMLAEITGRTYDMLTALGIMAAVSVGRNPLCVQNAGFWLSYGAILGIGVLYPVLLPQKEGKTARKYEEKRWKRAVLQTGAEMWKTLKQSFVSGLSVTVMTLPILLWFYYQVPVYSVFLNLLVIPLMSFVMTAGLLAMLLPGLGVIGTLDCVILSVYECLCEGFEQLPFAMWNPGRPKVWQLIIYYIGIAAVVVWRLARKNKRTAVPIVLSVLLAAVLDMDFSQDTTVTFLDVGQGDCICVQLSSGEVFLFDCGSSSRSRVGEYVLLPYLRYCGIQSIDKVFMSHADADHCNGMEELLANREAWGISIGEVATPQTGDFWKCGDSFFLCLHPPEGMKAESTNAGSQCFYMETECGAGKLKLLLTGDVEGSGGEALVQELQKRGIDEITVLKVPHHGSRNAATKELVQQITPRVAVISCGADNSYGHPHAETLERLEAVQSMIFSTPDYGAITVEAGRKITISSFTAPTESVPPHS